MFLSNSNWIFADPPEDTVKPTLLFSEGELLSLTVKFFSPTLMRNNVLSGSSGHASLTRLIVTLTLLSFLKFQVTFLF